MGAAYVPYLRRHLRAAHRHLDPNLTDLSVALIDDRRMAELHQQFMGIPGPTDVLTFPLDEDGRGRVTSGEVVVCVPEARRRAREYGVSVEKELLLYALHGMLHLCGFDDRTDAGFAAMHRIEDQILTAIGVGPVFATPRGDTGVGSSSRAGRNGSRNRNRSSGGAGRGRPAWQTPRRRAAVGPRSLSTTSLSNRSSKPGRGAEPIE